MRHRIQGKQLSRSTSHRMAMRRNMAASLFEHGAIRTTTAKAKELRRFVERLITIAKKGDLAARRRVVRLLQNKKIGEKYDLETGWNWYKDSRPTIVQKLFDEIAPRYASRNGGYTRIIRLSDRRIGDAGTQVVLQLVEEESAASEESRPTSRRRKRAAKRLQAAEGVAEAQTPTDSGQQTEDASTESDEDTQIQDDAGADEQQGEGELPEDAGDDGQAEGEDETKSE